MSQAAGAGCEILPDLLRQRALENPGRTAYITLRDGTAEEVRVTYADLDAAARSIAARLQDRGLAGERALLVHPCGPEFIAAFFGCLYAGVIAVPCPPMKFARDLATIKAWLDDCGARVICTSRQVLRSESARAAVSELASIELLVSDEIDPDEGRHWRPPAVRRRDVAYLQYTSGSTARPKGVIITHANVLSNLQDIDADFRHDDESVGVSWLPHFHDMGLVYGVLQPLYNGFPGVLMSPASFIQRPAVWLEAVTRYRGTHSGGPHSGYELCVRRITPEQNRAFDLRHWRVAFNGAEPVRKSTMDAFAAAFAPCGFRRDAFRPAFGLAEATLRVTVSSGVRVARPAGRQGDDTRMLVGCGRVSDRTRVEIVHPESLCRCAPGAVGEVWVAGPGVAQGYWEKPEDTQHTFHAYLADPPDGPFLRTGDLGFLRDGELFIAGRLKDLIIIRGRNYHPSDIEAAVRRGHARLEYGVGVAFSVEESEEERLVVVYEASRGEDIDWADVADAVCQAVVAECDVHVHEFVVVRKSSIPRTTSGKMQRQLCRTLYRDDGLKVVFRSRRAAADADPSGPRLSRDALSHMNAGERRQAIEGYVSHHAQRALQTESALDPRAPLALDSLMATELKHLFESALEISLPFDLFLERASVGRMARFIQEQVETGARATMLVHREAQNEYPLSFNQQSLWFMHRLAPDSPVYNVSGALTITSLRDTHALRRAFQRLVDRHAALRTTFHDREGVPVQIVHAQTEAWFRECRIDDPETLGARAAAESSEAFDLEQGPLLRATLFSSPDDSRVLLIVAHHIVVDFWSLCLLIQELGWAYRQELASAPAPPLHPGVEYADYVRFQAEMLDGERGRRLWDYWRPQLSGALPRLDLPFDRRRPSVPAFRGSSRTFSLTTELTHKLRELGRGHDASLFVVLLSAFQVLLYRWSGQEDIVIGAPATGRVRAEFAHVVGYFVNLIALRGAISGRLSFQEIVRRAGVTVVSALEHQELPFPVLVERLGVVRDPGCHPVFQAALVLQKMQGGLAGLEALAMNAPGVRMEIAGLPCESVAVDQPSTPFDLMLTAAELDGRLAISLKYSDALFDAVTIGRMADHLERLLQSVAGDAASPVAEIPLTSESERRLILSVWNATARAYPFDQGIAAVFEAQVAATPERPAIVWQGAPISYRKLNRRADAFARLLCDHGVQREARVGILMGRSLDFVVAVLAVLKAGAAYVPVDADYPDRRVAFMLKDAGVTVLLAPRQLRARAEAFGVATLCGDDLGAHASTHECADEPVGTRADPDGLACVMYTSGSTGTPKGIAVVHRGILRLVKGADYAAFDDEVFLQFAPVTFDASSFELWGCLLNGGTLVIVPQGPASLQELGAYIRQHRVSVLWLTSGLFNQITDADLGSLSGLRHLLAGGDVLSPIHVKRFRRELPACQLTNGYGPTETTTFACCHPIAAEPDGSTPIPIGRPIANTTAYVVDEAGNLAPVGVVGELYIGGPGLARGYWNRPELTAERFIPDAFGTAPGARLYRTGDRARYRHDGVLDYLGRMDEQVKIRGFRIEPGEIEAVLRQQEGVLDAVVTIREDGAEDKRLVACVAPEAGASPRPEEWERAWRDRLQRAVRQTLPDYMVPSGWVIVERLPLTPGGKVDRQALRDHPASTGPTTQSVPPATRLEQLLAGVWSDVLRVETIGVHDTFFELGGHSLLATRLVSRIEALLPVSSPMLSRFLERPTIAGMAALLEEDVPRESMAAVLDAYEQISRLDEDELDAPSSHDDTPMDSASR